MRLEPSRALPKLLYPRRRPEKITFYESKIFNFRVLEGLPNFKFLCKIPSKKFYGSDIFLQITNDNVRVCIFQRFPYLHTM